MRWNCPHCGVALAVTDDKLGPGWTFSRCYKCGGFALVRRAEVNLIKIDRAPMDEKVILPEATEEPMLSRDATRNMAQIRSGAASGIASPRPKTLTVPQNPIQQLQQQNQQKKAAAQNMAANTAAVAAVAHALRGNLPEPLPEEPEKSLRQKMMPFALVMVGLVTVASGVYLYRGASRLANRHAGKLQARSGVVVDTIAQESMAPTRNEETCTPNAVKPIGN